jgi:hypothetical protein
MEEDTEMDEVDWEEMMGELQAKIRQCHELVLAAEAMGHPAAALYREEYQELVSGWMRSREYLMNEIEILGARYDRLQADIALAEAVAAVEKREQGGAGA